MMPLRMMKLARLTKMLSLVWVLWQNWFQQQYCSFQVSFRYISAAIGFEYTGRRWTCHQKWAKSEVQYKVWESMQRVTVFLYNVTSAVWEMEAFSCFHRSIGQSSNAVGHVTIAGDVSALLRIPLVETNLSLNVYASDRYNLVLCTIHKRKHLNGKRDPSFLKIVSDGGGTKWRFSTDSSTKLPQWWPTEPLLGQ